MISYAQRKNHGRRRNFDEDNEKLTALHHAKIGCPAPNDRSLISHKSSQEHHEEIEFKLLASAVHSNSAAELPISEVSSVNFLFTSSVI